MDNEKDFYDLDAWQIGHKLVLETYEISKNFPQNELYELTNQIRRAVTSITANIAEGYGRFHYKDKKRFYYQSRGSVKELQNFLLVAKDLKYISKEEVRNVWELSVRVEKLINGLIRSVSTQLDEENV